MSIIDTTLFDFSRPAAGIGPRSAIVRNEAKAAVMHVLIRMPAPWVDVYPAEFALAPQRTQKIFVEIAPGRSRDALAPVSISLFAQYLHLNATAPGEVPAGVQIELSVVPPAANCPTCGVDLPDQARECRRCGERIRLCPICGAPNNWTTQTCRLDPSHVIRYQTDWLASPGGNSRHTNSLPSVGSEPLPGGRSAAGFIPDGSTRIIGLNLARKWTLPAFPPTRASDAYEWSAPLAAFGMVIATAIDSAGGRAFAVAHEMDTGSALWDVELPDPRGVYPDRGAPALSTDGVLYVATLGGHVTAIDAIRGTLRWSVQPDGAGSGAVYGGVAVAGNNLLVPLGNSLLIMDRRSGSVLRRADLNARIDTAPCAIRSRAKSDELPAGSDSMACVASEDGILTAISLETGAAVWSTTLDGSFDAAPITRDGVVYAATMAGTVYALNADDGAITWRTQASTKAIAVSPALSADGLLFVACDDGCIHIIAAATGNLIRSKRLADTTLRTSPVCADGIVFAGADDGVIYSIDADYQVHTAYQTTPGARIAGAGIALYGNLLTFAATNGVLYVLKSTP